MDGKPLATGTQLLFMQMEKGYAAFAHTDDKGTYELKWMREGSTRTEVPVGDYKILVQPPEVKDVEELSADEMLDGGAEDIQPAEPDFPKKVSTALHKRPDLLSERRCQHLRSGFEV